MESEIGAKQFLFSTVIEYFTKRGRPLSQEEIKKLQEEDQSSKQVQWHSETKKKDSDDEFQEGKKTLDTHHDEDNFEREDLNST